DIARVKVHSCDCPCRVETIDSTNGGALEHACASAWGVICSESAVGSAQKPVHYKVGVIVPSCNGPPRVNVGWDCLVDPARCVKRGDSATPIAQEAMNHAALTVNSCDRLRRADAINLSPECACTWNINRGDGPFRGP